MKHNLHLMRYSRLFVAISALLMHQLQLSAQIGGRGVYDFVNAPVTARVAALGGLAAPIDDGDINLALFNPALINASMSNQLNLSYVDYYADINFGSVQYAHDFNKIGCFAAGLQYYNYGSFDYADEGGNRDGQFSAADYVFVLGWGRQLDSSFSIGANAKFIGSAYESYNSYGLAVDVAGTYRTRSGWLMSLTARNIGREMKSFLPGEASAMPFSMQFGVSKRLDHVPFRVMVIYDQLQRWDLTYESSLNNSNTDPISGDKNTKTGFEKFGDQLMRHMLVGGEFYIGKNLSLRASYNYRRRQEMKLTDRAGMVGFSWGFGIRISKFNISYARAAYHIIGSPNYLTITTNLNSFSRK